VCGARAGSREARAALGYLAELFRFPGWMTADELLELHQRLAASHGGERERVDLLELVCDRVVILLGGRVVAAGTPSELARPRGVEIETNEGKRTFPEAGRDDIPRLVAELVRDGKSVYGARLLTSTLEDVYVEAVSGETS
jgi:ABC-2 type transport system ATP-binding protein